MTRTNVISNPASGRRVHLVLVPGFAGFDALGQLEYYAGVTPQFQKWKNADPPRRDRAVLHYFDNFPTAAVATRAMRLESYLAKRVARGEFMPGDEIALIGHSTGGLDIRQLIWNSAGASDRTIRVDGSRDSACEVKSDKILDMVHRVVFLSVPQWGTNIADWVQRYSPGRTAVIAGLRATVAGSQLPLVDEIEDRVAEWTADLTDAGFFRALLDALSEAQVDAATGWEDPARTAAAREAASQLELWLRHIAVDFRVIDDLTARRPLDGPSSPAHFDGHTRAREMKHWAGRQIKTRSYATQSKPPFRLDPNSPAPIWDLMKPWTYPECMRHDELSEDTDIVYRACYRACAGGPFRYPDPARKPKFKRFSGSQAQRPITVWDNDGIVNTASMLWPDGTNTLLVPCDHMDIVGHYAPAFAPPGTGRTYQAYDLLASGSQFGYDDFTRVWNGVFDFCVE